MFISTDTAFSLLAQFKSDVPLKSLSTVKFRIRSILRLSWRDVLFQLGIDVADDDDDNTNSRRLGIIQRDKEMEKKAREGKKKDKSLLDMHQKELKKKKKVRYFAEIPCTYCGVHFMLKWTLKYHVKLISFGFVL